MSDWSELDESELDDLKKVLVVDDEKFIVALIEEVISSMDGYISKAFSTSKDALEFAKTHELDLILIDYLMPGVLGADFILQIREFDGPNKSVPFLIISANPEIAEEKLVGIDGVDYLAKPIQIPQLMEEVEKATS